MNIEQIISGIALVLIGIVIFVAVVYTIKNYKANKERDLLISEQLDKTLQLLRQPLSKTSALQSACSPPLSHHSESIESQLLTLILQNRTGFYGA